VRIISIKKLKEFWEKPRYSDSEIPLKIWISLIKKGNWKNPNEVLKDFPDADNVGNSRIVFNIKHNDFRLIVVFRYRIQICYIRFIRTHKEYDKVKNIKEI
jgi:mRNA interferase HigB